MAPKRGRVVEKIWRNPTGKGNMDGGIGWAMALYFAGGNKVDLTNKTNKKSDSVSTVLAVRLNCCIASAGHGKGKYYASVNSWRIVSLIRGGQLGPTAYICPGQ